MSNEEEKINEAVEPEAEETAADESVKAEGDAPAEKSNETVTDKEQEETAPEAPEEAEKEDVKPAVKHAEKPSEPKPAKKSGALNSMFKRIYFPLVAILVVVMAVFSIIDALCGYSPKAYDDNYYTAVDTHVKEIAGKDRSDLTSNGASAVADYIVNSLTVGSFVYADTDMQEADPESKEEEELLTETDWSRVSNAPIPTVTRLTAVPTSKLQLRHSLPVFTAGKEITDIIAAIPSEATRLGKESASVIVTVRYDSRADSPEAALAGFVGSAIETLKDYVKSGKIPANDIVVVFTEDMDYAYGTYLFVDTFKGLGDVVSRAKAAVNLEAYGNGGTLAVTDASHAGLNYFNDYASLSGTAFNSSIAADAVPDAMKLTNAVDAFAYADVPVVQVAVLGKLNNAQSAADSYSNLPKSTLRMQSDFLKSYFDEVGGTDKTYEVNDNKLVFFSYFDWGTVAYDNIAAYVIAALTLAVLIGAIVINALKKTFSLYRMLVAVGVQFLVFASALVAMFAAYFLVTLMLTGFGAIPLNAIVQARYSNAGILIAALLVAFASAFGFTTVYKKLFKVTSSDTVRGNAILVALIAVVFGFAAPAYSYAVSWLGLLMAAVLIATVCLNAKFKNSFGYGMDRLFLFVIPVIITMPLTMSTVASLATLWPVYLLPVVMLLFVAMLGTAVPYLDRTTPVLDKLAKKLPMRTQRVERTVTEKVEDRAKKGKFTEQTVTRVEKVKIPVNYKNYFGISVVTVIAVVIALFSGAFAASFGQTVTLPNTYDSSIYNDSIIYEWTKTSGGSATSRLVVGDTVAYKYARYAIDDLKWDASVGKYVKSVNDIPELLAREPEITRNAATYEITTMEDSSVVTITIPSATSITKVILTDSRDNKYEYFFNRSDTIVLRLPYGTKNCSMVFEGASPSTIQYEERSSFTLLGSTSNPLDNIDDLNAMIQYYAGTSVANDIRGGIVLKATFSF